ncbi:TIGR02147 family protein [Pseudobacteriovorax antillogorgiicola]|uniref:TIGR02147 family protein n=1 Tax=Pseudobacteriovorax antillogorgiicola TaxID=1513793 RepID=A0A1Y6C880_9BACT|nr:TIGR02147 family protein [Pseudobacteriovorax antillogorgiicola]TCS49324.1 uncharacterized protein (TIGR02147 family) [Pseudobacteriovorax antillogorgiicola]SMF48060.1 TIGR02147 family protein [Pseudobacteriovorax antillogorgiicola]
MDIFRYTDYRDILREELVRRVQQNPNYSQGAFARDISLTPSRLSEILNGKQGISVRVAIDIAKHLKFSEDQCNFFGDLVESQHGRSRLSRESARARLDRYRHSRTFSTRLEAIQELLSKWYYLGILELIKVEGFAVTPEAIATALKIDLQEADRALNRLKDMGLLTVNFGQYQRSSHQNGVSGNLGDPGLLKFHSQMIDLSLRQPHKQDEQHVHDFIMSIDSSKLSYLLTYLKESLEYFVGRADDGTKKDSVYGLSVSFFPISAEAPAKT